MGMDGWNFNEWQVDEVGIPYSFEKLGWTRI